MLVLAAALVSAALVLAAPADASCRPPVPVAENAARASVVVHATVTGAGGGAVTLRVDRVLKGHVGASLRAFVGPGRGGTTGTAVATSVDYSAAVGSDHVLYLIGGSDGQLETNACIGSHAGPPSADEVAYFGAGTSPDRAVTPPPPIVPEASASIREIQLIWPALALAVLGSVILANAVRRRGAAGGA